MYLVTLALTLLLAAVHLVHATPVDGASALESRQEKGTQFYTYSGSFFRLTVVGQHVDGAPVSVGIVDLLQIPQRRVNMLMSRSSFTADFPGWISPSVWGSQMRLAGTNLCLDAGRNPRPGTELKIRRCEWWWWWQSTRQQWFGRDDNFLRDAPLELVGRHGGHSRLCARAGDPRPATHTFNVTLALCNDKDVNQMWTSQQHG